MVFCFGTNQKKFQALEFLPRLKSFLSRREKRTPDRRLFINSLKNSRMQTEYLRMKEEKSFSLNYVLLVLSASLQFTLVIHLC